MSCPICEKPKPQNVHFTCPDCWVTVPTKDRQLLGQMLRRKQSTTSKLASVVKKVRELRGLR